MKKWPILITISVLALLSLANFRTAETTTITLQSFTTGKVSPRLEARQDFPKYQSSLRTLENFLISPLGPVQRRPGTRFVATAKTGTPRMVKFEYSTDDVYAIEMGDKYMRFYRNGGPILTGGGSVYEIVSPFDANEISAVRYAQSGNLMYMADGNDVPQILTRTAHNAWTINPIAQEGGPFLNENEDESSTIDPNATTGVIDLVATGAIFDSDHEGALWQISHLVEANDVSGRFWTSGDSNSTSISIFEGQTYTVNTGGDWWGTFSIERSYDNELNWETVKPFAARGNVNVLYEGIELEDDADYRVVMRDQTVTGHMRRHGEGECDYTLATDVFTRNGIVEITTVSGPNNATATVITDLASTDATWRWSEGMWSDYSGWPKMVAFHQQRAVYGGSDSYPTALWWSQTGSDSYDDFLTGTLDTDAFWVDLPGMNPIRWILSGDYLLVGTSGSVGRYGKQGMPITPTSPSYVEQSDHGSANVQAVVAGDTVLYVERNGRKVREFGYNLQYDRYTTPDLTLLSEEITDPCIVELAFQSQPQPTLWCVLANGDLATLLYQRDQVIAGWSLQNTEASGEFKSIVSIPAGGLTPAGNDWTEDSLWAVVERTIDSTQYRFIENFTPVDWGPDNDYCWFVDGGLGGTSSGGGDLTIHSPAVGEYPTLRALAGGDIPAAPSQPSDTAADTAVSNSTELAAMSGATKYYLTANIDLNGVAWTPITNFTGVLDGRDFTISNLTIDAAASDNQAMFGTCGNGVEIYDLTLDNFTITGDDKVAALMAEMNATGAMTITDVNVTNSTITGDTYVASFVGAAWALTTADLFQCAGTANTIVGQNSSGGLFGDIDLHSTASADLNVVGCSVSGGSISGADGDYIGGLVGIAVGRSGAGYKVVFHTCSSSMAVNITGDIENVGGFGGYLNFTEITTCFTTGNVALTSPSGYPNPIAAGGFTGFCVLGNIYTDCYATGNVSVDSTGGGTSQLIGGFTGKCDHETSPDLTSYLRCYATGDVTMTGLGSVTWSGVGGFMGGFLGNGSEAGGWIKKCWASGDLSLDNGDIPDSGKKGGLGGFLGLGYQNGATTSNTTTIENCYGWGSITVATLAGTDLGVSGFIGSYAHSGSDAATIAVTNTYDAQTDTAAGSGYTDQIPIGTYSQGLIGYVEGSITITETSSYWDTQTSGISSDSYAIGHGTAWLQTEANFEAAGWDMTDIWILTETNPVEDPNQWAGLDPLAPGGAMEVCVYADGNSIGTYTVDTNGVINLGAAYDVVIAGLNYWSKLETLPLVIRDSARITDKRITALSMDLYESTYLEYGLGSGATMMVADFNDVTTSIVDFKRMAFLFGSMKKATIYVQTFEPLPLCIRAIIPEVSYYRSR